MTSQNNNGLTNDQGKSKIVADKAIAGLTRDIDILKCLIEHYTNSAFRTHANKNKYIALKNLLTITLSQIVASLELEGEVLEMIQNEETNSTT